MSDDAETDDASDALRAVFDGPACARLLRNSEEWLPSSLQNEMNRLLVTLTIA